MSINVPISARIAPGAASEMSRRVHEMDWSKTPLGPMEDWPPGLVTAVGICLNSRFPMFVWWGPELIKIYNDAYGPVLGKRHPAALGKPAREVWHEIWDILGPQAEAVMTRGESTWNERVLLAMERNGYLEETYFTWSYSPIPDGRGGIGGLFCACTEDTGRVAAERERDQLADQRQLALDAARMGWWHLDPRSQTLHWDPRCAAIFDVDPGSPSVAEILGRLHPEDVDRVRGELARALDPDDATPYDAEYRIIRSDGSVRWAEAHGVADFRSNGSTRVPVSLVGTVADITERKQDDERRRTSEERLALAVDAGELGTFYCPLPMGLIVWNDKCSEHFWLPPGTQVDFDRFYLILHPDDREPTRKAVEQAIFDRRPYDAQYRVVAPDGRIRWVHAKGRAYYDASGQPTRFDGVTMDITAQKERESELARSERRFREMADTAPAMLWITEADGYCSFLSRGWYEFTGQSVEESLGLGWTQAAHPDDREAAGAAFVAANRARVEYEVDFRIRRADGEYRWVLDAGRPRFGSDGEFLGFIGSVIDITDRKLAAVAAQESEQRLRGIFRQTTAGIAQVDLEGRFIEVNDRYCEIVNRTAAELKQLTVADVTDPADMPENRARLKRLMSENASFDIEKRYVRPDGTRVWVSNSVSPIIDLAGRPTSIVAFTVDITERKRAEQQRQSLLEAERAARAEADHASQMKDEFLATLSHELRTPLNAILGWSKIIGRGNPSAADVTQGVEVIERNARAQAQIIEDLLEMSRIISGKIRLDMKPVDLRQIGTEAWETARPTADAKAVILLCTTVDKSKPLLISGDPNRLQQVLWNLITNAIKFTPSGGTVAMSLESTQTHARLSIVDTGEGISVDFLPFVFDRFRQADASTTRRYGGLGLGLSIVKQLVELHGGTVEVHSDGPGKGARFTVSLPLVTAPAREEASPAQAPTHSNDGDRSNGEGKAAAFDGVDLASIAGVRVLVVDDEADARMLTRRLLEDCEAIVTTAGSAIEAEALLGENQFDVLVSDIGMPGEDGHALIRRVRSRGPANGGNVPAVALTAYARADDRVKAIQAGFQMHIAKPVEPAELIAVVASLAKRT